MAQIMTTKELAVYLRLHQLTICKLSKEGKIPSIRIGRVWRFDKEVIDEWIAKGQESSLIWVQDLGRHLFTDPRGPKGMTV